MITWLATAGGLLLVLGVFRDVFQTLFNPTGRGQLSRLAMRTAWRVGRRLDRARPGSLRLAGPLGMLATVGGWAAMTTLGFALVYWPRIPDGFRFTVGVRAEEFPFVDAVSFSLVSLTTVGYGNVAPTGGWLKVVGPLEAAIGFGLLTASLSWLLSVYPAVGRLRALAERAEVLRALDEEHGRVEAADLRAIAEGIVESRFDLVQHPAAYYFRDPHDRVALPAILPYLHAVSSRASSDERTRLAADVLARALAGFAETLRREHVADERASTAEAFRAYADDHRVAPRI